jgi:hypothetical protein
VSCACARVSDASAGRAPSSPAAGARRSRFASAHAALPPPPLLPLPLPLLLPLLLQTATFQAFLKRYLNYAKARVHPELCKSASDFIAAAYATLRYATCRRVWQRVVPVVWLY